MPASFTTASTKEGIVAPPLNSTSVWNAVPEFLDYNTLAAVEATCKTAPRYHAIFEFVEVPFTQGAFPWEYNAFGELRPCTSTCVFVALLVAERFALQPQEFKATWRSNEMLRTIYDQASRLHSEYFHRVIQPT